MRVGVAPDAPWLILRRHIDAGQARAGIAVLALVEIEARIARLDQVVEGVFHAVG